MNQIKNKFVLTIFLSISMLFVYGQDVEIKGKILDENSNPIPGVNILVKGTSNGSISDFDGNYTISQVSIGDVLVFSYIGYQNQEITVSTNNSINVTLIEASEYLDEVVVIGYGTVKKSDLTGAISAVGEEDFNTGVNTTPDQMLIGKVAGVQISQSNGEPGGGVTVRVRGSNSINAGNDPLYVIDGLPIDNSSATSNSGQGISGGVNRNPLASLNPSDIESIQILKDASSTAIYGSRGANGVIMITTKKGKSGKGTINYSLQTGVQTIANQLELLKTNEFANVINAISVAEGGAPIFDLAQLGQGADYLDLVTDKGTTQDHNLSFSGGSDTFNYFASLNYFEQDGILINSGMERYATRINLANKFSDKFKMGLNLGNSVVKDNFVSNGNGSGGNNLLASAIQYDPTLDPFDENEEIAQTDVVDLNNPLAIAEIYSAASTHRTFGTIFGEYNFTPELSYKLKIGTDVISSRRDGFNPTTTKYGASVGGAASIATVQRESYLIEHTLNYNKSFENHTLNAVAGYTFEKFSNRSSSQNVSGFGTNVLLSNNMGLGDITTAEVGSNKNTPTLISYLGRINYAAFDKYLVTVSFRADGSSRFGENNKFAYFPSLALAWKVSNEKFLEDNKTISTLKLRTSWGKTGNQDISNYKSLALFNSGGQAIYNNLPVIGVNATQIPNPDLKWETTDQFDFGVDLGLLDYKIVASIDYYVKETSDLLLNFPIPGTSGFSSILQNVGAVRNSGFEFTLETKNIRKDDFSWDSNLNFSTVKNEVLDLGGTTAFQRGDLPFTQGISIVKEGAPLGAYYGYIVDGIFQEGDDIANSTTPTALPGHPIYRDLIPEGETEGDGLINTADRTVIGSPIPDFMFGFNNTLKYKKFQLDVFINGELGGEILSQNLMESMYPIEIRRNRLAEPLLNRWTPENPSTKWPSGINPTSTYGSNGKAVNTLAIQDASFVRLRNVRLTYNIDTAKFDFIKNASVYIAGENLAIWTKDYIGFDPEVNSFGNSSMRVDYNSYPTSRTILAGININF